MMNDQYLSATKLRSLSVVVCCREPLQGGQSSCGHSRLIHLSVVLRSWLGRTAKPYIYAATELLKCQIHINCFHRGIKRHVIKRRVACSLVTIDLKSGRDSSSKNCKDINNREKRLFSFISCCIMVQAGDHYNRTINSDMPPALSLVFRMITSECDSLQ